MGSRTLQMVRQKIAEVYFIVNMAHKVFHEWYENYYLCLAGICFQPAIVIIKLWVRSCVRNVITVV